MSIWANRLLYDFSSISVVNVIQLMRLTDTKLYYCVLSQFYSPKSQQTIINRLKQWALGQTKSEKRFG